MALNGTTQQTSKRQVQLLQPQEVIVVQPHLQWTIVPHLPLALQQIVGQVQMAATLPYHTQAYAQQQILLPSVMSGIPMVQQAITPTGHFQVVHLQLLTPWYWQMISTYSQFVVSLQQKAGHRQVLPQCLLPVDSTDQGTPLKICISIKLWLIMEIMVSLVLQKEPILKM